MITTATSQQVIPSALVLLNMIIVFQK